MKYDSQVLLLALQNRAEQRSFLTHYVPVMFNDVLMEGQRRTQIQIALRQLDAVMLSYSSDSARVLGELQDDKVSVVLEKFTMKICNGTWSVLTDESETLCCSTVFSYEIKSPKQFSP